MYDPLVDWAVAEDTVGGGNDTATSSNRHRAVGGGGERDRHHIGGTATALGATEMAFGIETARKQMQDEFNRDTLIIQFTELKPDWLQNRSVTHLNYMRNFPFIYVLYTIEIKWKGRMEKQKSIFGTYRWAVY